MAGHNVRTKIPLPQLEPVNRVATILLTGNDSAAREHGEIRRDAHFVTELVRTGRCGGKNVIGRQENGKPAARAEMKSFRAQSEAFAASRRRGKYIVDG